MSESVSLPALGESVTEGTVTRWLKKVGDRVEVDEPLLEVSTDKVDTEIPSPVAGVIEAILVAEDETVEVGTALVTIGDGASAGAPPVSAPTVAAEPHIEPPLAPPAPPVGSSPFASYPAPTTLPESSLAPPPPPSAPAPSYMPAEAGTPAPQPTVQTAAPTPEEVTAPIPAEVPSTDAAAPDESPTSQPPAPASFIDLAPNAETSPVAEAAANDDASVSAAGPASDVATAAPDADSSNAGYVTPLVRKLAHERGVDLAGVTGTGVGGRIRKQDVLAATDPSVPNSSSISAAALLPTSPLRGTTVAMSRLRRVIADRAVASLQASAQLTSVVEVDVTRVAVLRAQVKERFAAQTGVKLSFLPFFALAAAEALRVYPIINASIDGDSIVYPPTENMSIAVDTERGLLTPVIRECADLSIAEFATQIADLAARTRANKLLPDELAGGTFTLTNTGSRGALFDTPIVFLPQSAILGTGIVAKRAVVVTDVTGDAIAIRSMVFLALSYDHRIVDGADAARFLVTVKDRLEAGEFEGNLGL